MIRTILIDDEEGGRKTLSNLLNKYCQGIDLVGQAEDVDDGIRMIDALKPDLMFLDIQLKEDRTTFDILRKIKHQNYSVIFTTAHNEYAVKAFRFNAIDYLLKPINLEELLESIEKVKKYLNSAQNTINSKVNQMLSFNHQDPTITLATENTLEFIRVKDIIRLQANGSYSIFFLNSGKELIVSKNLKNYNDILTEYNFFRTHQSHMVNMNYVVRLLKTDGGSIELNNGTTVPISRRRKELFLQMRSLR